MTTKRSELDPETLLAKLQAHGVERLRGEAHVWVVIDGSNLRKPYAQAMEYPQRVRRLDGAGTLPGYPTLNVIGIGRERRGLLDNKLYSSAAPTSGASRPRCGRRSARSGGRWPIRGARRPPIAGRAGKTTAPCVLWRQARQRDQAGQSLVSLRGGRWRRR